MELDDEFGSTAVETPTGQPELEESYPTMEVWKDVGRSIEKEHGEIRWKIGEWLLAGKREFGKRAYKEAAAVTGYAVRTLYDLARIAERVPTSVRTEKLSWNHHRAVEGLWQKPEAQEEWLRQAIAAKQSVVALKAQMRRQDLPGYPRKTITGGQNCTEDRLRDFRVRFNDTELKVIGRLADIRNISPSELVRTVVLKFLDKPETKTEIENADLNAKAEATENRRAAQEKWEKEMISSINGLLERYSDLASSTMPDPGDFVSEWERLNNRKFPFHFAMKHTEFYTHYHGISAEDARCCEYSRFENSTDEELGLL